MIEHHGGVADGIIPEFAPYLLFSDVSTGHCDDGPPCAFSEAIRRLATCGSSNNVGVVGEDPLESLTPDELFIEVGVKAFGHGSGVGAELLESINDFRGGEGGKTVDPAVAGGNIHKKESITKPP